MRPAEKNAAIIAFQPFTFVKKHPTLWVFIDKIYPKILRRFRTIEKILSTSL